MPIDSKYGRITVEKEPGKPFTDDEPVFLLRASDVVSSDVLRYYAYVCEDYDAPDSHIESVSEIRGNFDRWQEANVDKVKVPD